MLESSPLSKKSWFTVYAVYDDNQQPWCAWFEARDVADARAQALQAVNDIIIIAAIVAGKILPLDGQEVSNITPLKARGHTITVAHHNVTTRCLAMPTRCPGCSRDLRRARALTATTAETQTWPVHLAKDRQQVALTREQTLTECSQTTRPLPLLPIRLTCSTCRHSFWEGLHAAA